MTDFDDLLIANKSFANEFSFGGFDGVANAGVCMVTCMDSRIDPLAMIGIKTGDAKILRNPGGRVTDQVLVALVVSVAMLNVNRILLVEHTRCAMGSLSEDELHEKLSEITGTDSTWLTLGVIDDQEKAVIADVHKVRSHPLINADVLVGGFIYDVDTGLLRQVA
jgi:carbonic anhydrase